ncbi:MAG TPA: toll/interleukin-1 receptor domain-containing protein [Phycisphaerales bacterium]|nr:toll/interleukin-1 receptor domain-containing protein [Phycisphaerales bacterium]
MARSVFISYAAKDPDWPLELVVDLASALRQRGVSVRFDRFYRQQLGRKPSDDEWMRWMRAAVKASDKIACLCSPRYLEASDRNVADPSGYGVAFEAQKLIHQLYQSKGFNEGRISCVLREGRSRESSVPEDLRSDCARYHWPAEKAELLDDLTRAEALNEETQADSAHDDSGADRRNQTRDEDNHRRGSASFHRRQEDFTLHALAAAPAFLQALQADLRSRRLNSQSWLLAEPDVFVDGLARADKQVAHQLT